MPPPTEPSQVPTGPNPSEVGLMNELSSFRFTQLVAADTQLTQALAEGNEGAIKRAGARGCVLAFVHLAFGDELTAIPTESPLKLYLSRGPEGTAAPSNASQVSGEDISRRVTKFLEEQSSSSELQELDEEAMFNALLEKLLSTVATALQPSIPIEPSESNYDKVRSDLMTAIDTTLPQ